MTLQDSINLLIDDFYSEHINCSTYDLLVSRFKEKEYNYIIPKVNFERLNFEDLAEKTLEYTKSGYEFSFYIDSKFIDSYRTKFDYFDLLYEDLYIYGKFQSQFEVEKFKFVKSNERNLDQFINAAQICFPGWSNNNEFTKWCNNSVYNDLYGIEINESIASFAASFSKPNSEFVLLMNDGTLPDFQRQGMHNNLIKYRINKIIDKYGVKTFYANVEPNSQSHKNYQKLGFIEGPLFFVYKSRYHVKL